MEFHPKETIKTAKGRKPAPVVGFVLTFKNIVRILEPRLRMARPRYDNELHIFEAKYRGSGERQTR